MPNNKVVETRIATLTLDKNEILIISMKNCGKVDEYDVVDINLVIRHLSNAKPTLKLLDARANWNMSRDAKVRARVGEQGNITRARAIVVSTKIKVGLFSFLQEFSKKEYPQRFFNNYEEAYEWLLQQRVTKSSLNQPH